MSSWCRHLAIPACLAMACAIPSCAVMWNTADNVKAGKHVYMGFDTLHPVDGKVYVGADGKSYYMQAQEVTYTTAPRLVRTNGTDEQKMGEPTPTGRTAWIEVKPCSTLECPPEIVSKTGIREIPFYFSDWKFCKEESALPVGSTLWNTGETFKREPEMMKFGAIEQAGQSAPGASRKALSIPFTYVVDPVLSTASSAVYGVAFLGAAAAYVSAFVVSVPVCIVTLGQIPLLAPMPIDSVSPPPLWDIRIEAVERGTSFVYNYVPHGKDKGEDGYKWRSTYLPAHHLRKVVDTGTPLMLTLDCYGKSDEEMEARLRAALAPLQAEGIPIRIAIAIGDKKWVDIEPGAAPQAKEKDK